MNTRIVGVTVMPEFFQNEGVERVLDNLQRAGCNAFATSPYVMQPADEKTGSREPPIDAGAGKVRLLERPLWGKRELYVATAPSYSFDPVLYKGLKYQPTPASDLTRKEGALIGHVVQAAKARHMKVYLQVQAAIPPGYRVQFGGPADEDRPRLPDGSLAPHRLANNGSLASPHIVEYTAALLRDMLRAYPNVDGLRVDWPEYPPYFLHDCFFDFSEPARAMAKSLGYDFDAIQKQAQGQWKLLHGGLTDRKLEELAAMQPGGMAKLPWMQFKAALVEELFKKLRGAMDSEPDGKAKELVPGVFPAPWCFVSGMDYKRVAKYASAISLKLYTMHWPVMLRFYADELKEANPGLSDVVLARSLERVLGLRDDGPLALAEYKYPEPDEPHPAGERRMAERIKFAQKQAGKTSVYAIAHGYGPLADFKRRFEVASRSSRHGVWVNRYGYLSDAKLQAMKEVL
ncbi:MAG: hypothetical protein ABI972_25045 [Acidobacteriota bacterium]